MGTAGVKLAHDPFDFVKREEWGALPPIARLYLDLPANVVVLHFTNTKQCHTRQECVRVIRKLQRKHMGPNNQIDIKYNFIIGGDGSVYEGRGWYSAGVKVPLVHEFFMSGTRFEAIDVAFVGTVEDMENSKILQKTSDSFLKESKLTGKLSMESFYLWMEGGDKAWKAERLKIRQMRKDNWWYRLLPY